MWPWRTSCLPYEKNYRKLHHHSKLHLNPKHALTWSIKAKIKSVSEKETWTECPLCCCVFIRTLDLKCIPAHVFFVTVFDSLKCSNDLLCQEDKVHWRSSAWVLMNLCHPHCCFRRRHGWLITVWTRGTKPTAWRVSLGLHLLRYHRFDLYHMSGNICLREGETEVPSGE